MSFQAFFDEQGWTPDTALKVAIDFIESQSMGNEFKAYLHNRATNEHSTVDEKPLPLNIRDAIDDHEHFGKLYLCEFGVFDESDANTAHDSFEMLAVAYTPAEAETYAQSWLSNNPIERFGSATFSLMSAPKQINLSDYYFQNDDGEWCAVI